MRLGLFTSAFPGLPLERVAEWAAANGYEMLELAAWPPSKAERRYAGVTHVDAENLDRQGAAAIRGLLQGLGLGISSLGYYPNPLDPDRTVAEPAITHIKKVIDAAARLVVPVVGTFVGGERAWLSVLETPTAAGLLRKGADLRSEPQPRTDGAERVLGQGFPFEEVLLAGQSLPKMGLGQRFPRAHQDQIFQFFGEEGEAVAVHDCLRAVGIL